MATIPFNPFFTTNSPGTFNVTSDGYIQGCAMDSPAIRNSLAGGVLALAETQPMWGGVGISENVPGVAGMPQPQLGRIITRATSVATLSGSNRGTVQNQLGGFSVFDQNYAAVSSPGSAVPMTPSYGEVNYYRLGSGARIPVACSPSLVSVEGRIVTTPLAWDFTNQSLEPLTAATISSGTYPAAATIASGTYTAGNGAVQLVTNVAHGLLPGDPFSLNGMTGTGSFANLNGTWIATTGTTGTTLNFTAATGQTMTITGGNLGTIGISLTTSVAHGLVPGDTFALSSATGTGSFATINGTWLAQAGTTASTLRFVKNSDGSTSTITGGSLDVGGGPLPVRILDINVGNSMIVVYDPVSNTARWNRNGTCALIQL